MVEQACRDYADIFQNINPNREMNPISMNIDDMLARLDEFGTLLTNVKDEMNGILQDDISSLLNFQENFEGLRKRIDNLEGFVNVVNENVLVMERTLDIAEEELHVMDYSLKGFLLKPLFAKAKAVSTSVENSIVETKSNLKEGEFQTVQIFKSTTYFGDSMVNSTKRAHELP